MMEIAQLLLLCAVFAALVIVAVTAALKSARVSDVIGEVFSPWLEESFSVSDAPTLADRGSDGSAPRPQASKA